MSSRHRTQLLREGYPQRPEMGAALSRALLERVAAGEINETIRLSRPGRVVAFGRRDAVAPGYAAAVSAARECGYEAMERLAGGRAAIYFDGALSLTRTVYDRTPARRTQARFEEICEILADAIASFGIDARIGEVEGEYCPGAFSVNASGRVKLAGVGQRMIKGAAHTGVVIVVERSEEVRRVLAPVYDALGLGWDPDTAGAVAEEVPADRPTPDLADVEAALLESLSNHFDLEPRTLDSTTLARAERIATRFRSPESLSSAGDGEHVAH